ncbi:hypothetical protein, partial [Aquiflexum sp.]|uniref:hypothetical protein n=1 Tax=Aquiflexum sp. TaxID=1872584 RepID=UPI00359435B1
MLIIQYNTPENLPNQLEEGSVGLSFILKDNFPLDKNPLEEKKPILVMHEGTVLIKKLELTVKGHNDNSRFSKNLEIEYNTIKKVAFDTRDESEDFFLNIPEGTYDAIDFRFFMADYEKQPSVFLEATYVSPESEVIPVMVELFESDLKFDLKFDTVNSPSPKIYNGNLNNSSMVFVIHADRWFDGFSIDDLQ